MQSTDIFASSSCSHFSVVNHQTDEVYCELANHMRLRWMSKFSNVRVKATFDVYELVYWTKSWTDSSISTHSYTTTIRAAASEHRLLSLKHVRRSAICTGLNAIKQVHIQWMLPLDSCIVGFSHSSCAVNVQPFEYPRGICKWPPYHTIITRPNSVLALHDLIHKSHKEMTDW